MQIKLIKPICFHINLMFQLINLDHFGSLNINLFFEFAHSKEISNFQSFQISFVMKYVFLKR